MQLLNAGFRGDGSEIILQKPKEPKETKQEKIFIGVFSINYCFLSALKHNVVRIDVKLCFFFFLNFFWTNHGGGGGEVRKVWQFWSKEGTIIRCRGLVNPFRSICQCWESGMGSDMTQIKIALGKRVHFFS